MAQPAMPDEMSLASVALTVAQQALHPDPAARRVGQKHVSSVQLAMAASIGEHADEHAPTANSGPEAGVGVAPPPAVKLSALQMDEAWRRSDADVALTVW